MRSTQRVPLAIVLCVLGVGCGGSDTTPAHVRITNDFNDPMIMTFQPPWTLCRVSYLGTSFGQVAIGATSAEQSVSPGIDNVLMVAAWNDPTCSPAHSLPIASLNLEEVLPGQSRTITIGLSNHQGPCPPTGVAPMPQALYDRILALWPEFHFQPYAQRTMNTQCTSSM